MEEMHHLAWERRIGMASEKMKTRYDARATGHDFDEGDKVVMDSETSQRILSEATDEPGKFHISELLRGVGYILTTRNHIALWGRKCFPDAVDGVVRKFRAFVQGIFLSHKNAKLVGWTRTQS
ncbi:hypothetical protein TNCV_4712701 [Trichonephila clavipes]|nr:hypothetical protein TNCV_4712701 [Trichonephila clavipes]